MDRYSFASPVIQVKVIVGCSKGAETCERPYINTAGKGTNLHGN